MHPANIPRERQPQQFCGDRIVMVLIPEVLDPSSDATEVRVGWTLLCERYQATPRCSWRLTSAIMSPRVVLNLELGDDVVFNRLLMCCSTTHQGWVSRH